MLSAVLLQHVGSKEEKHVPEMPQRYVVSEHDTRYICLLQAHSTGSRPSYGRTACCVLGRNVIAVDNGLVDCRIAQAKLWADPVLRTHVLMRRTSYTHGVAGLWRSQ
jgi:hypothetical protein